MKSFKEHFYILLNKLKNNEYLSFSRFSDGEAFIMQNKALELSERGTLIENNIAGPQYAYEDFKEFNPSEHQFFREKLIDAFKYRSAGYFVGSSCPCCIGPINAKWMKELRGGDVNIDPHYIWANQFLNSNYPLFIKEFLPELQKRKCVIICNENADLTNAELNIVKDFRVGRNCLINNFNIHEDISKWIIENDIKDHVFLFSASSLTNICCYELWQKHPNNFYLDIGTTLNKQLNMSLQRDYLKAYWTGQYHPDLFKTCVL